jgi:fido (protein-threonine AMPylation protein)
MYEIPSFAAGMVTEYLRQADELIVLHLHQSGSSQSLHTALELLARARGETMEWQRTANLIVDYQAAQTEVAKEQK